MQRLLLLAAVVLCFAMPALAQTTWSGRKTDVARSNVQPPEPLPERALDRRSLRVGAGDDFGLASDSLSDQEILRRISRVYRYQADILSAQVQGDNEQTESLLGLAMAELSTLSQQPGIMERSRFRELYRSVITEYERYYGASDTLMALPYGDIYQLRADMFAAMEDIDEPLLEDVMLPEIQPMDTVFPMTMNRLVESSIKYLLRNPDKHINNWLRRANTYFPMIEQVFREEGVPDELKYLAMIESGLVPYARSWAQAAGMWQFIAPTGRAYGLQVNPWVDERLDPEKATHAAARHLKDLYEMYDHDWQIAIAGYNCSPRCIKRAIRRSGKNAPTFWDIYPYLPRETRGYVPMFIATALLASNPESFGLTPEPGPHYAYDHVPVQGMISLEDIAEMAGTDLATIKALNPSLRRGTIPPSRDPYMVRIPLGRYQQFAQALEALPESARRPVGEYVVRRGDSLGRIAAKYGMSVTKLKRANGLRSNIIHPGQRLVVPVPNYSGTVSLADAKPVSVEYGSRLIRPIEPLNPGDIAESTRRTPVVQASSTSTASRTASASKSTESKASESKASSKEASSSTRIVYRVRRGDTLGRIARKYGVSVRQIQSWNNLRGTRIRSGQRLTLYSSGGSSEPERIVYRVRRGDNLTEIARKYGVSVRQIKSWNSLRNSRIVPGQRLTIHPGSSEPQYSVYKVRRGDSLGKIASRYGTSVRNLKRWNGLRGSTIHPGQRLKIYN